MTVKELIAALTAMPIQDNETFIGIKGEGREISSVFEAVKDLEGVVIIEALEDCFSEEKIVK